jgi:hypothetical protein
MKADLWRLLVLWEYGGIFSDIDSCPNHLVPSIIEPDDDALFIMDQGGKLAAFHFMAVAPRHPLLFIVLQESLRNLMIHPDTGLMNPIKLTGPLAFGRGIYQFIRLGRPDRGSITKIPVNAQPGLHKGIDGRWIRILPYTESGKDYWVLREVQTSRIEKIKQYQKMNMTYFYDQMSNESGVSCIEAIMRDTKEKT